MDSSTVQRVELKNLDPNATNCLVVGIIIATQKLRKFSDVKTPNDSGTRAVWNFTIRDSIQDYINVTYWGTSDLIQSISERYHIGDVVDIINPKINIRQLNDYGESFRPMVTSPYSLTMVDRSAIVQHVGGSIDSYKNLLRYPTKPVAGFVTLRDVHTNGASMADLNVDILGAVRSLNNVRNVQTKSGEILQVREIDIFDHTSPNLRISFWDSELINRSNSWRPRSTILFLTDLSIQWSGFSRSFAGTVTGRTIVTENPICGEAQTLAKYAENAPIETSDIIDQLINNLPDLNTIQNVMSVRQIHDKINELTQANQSGNKQFTAVLYAFLTRFDLDGVSRSIMIRCGRCKIQLEKNRNCENPECIALANTIQNDMTFDIRVILSDHTGSLLNCRFGKYAAEVALGCTPEEFVTLSDQEKSYLKWKYLLERCTVRISVVLMNNGPVVSILGMSLSNKFEVSQKLPVY